MANQVSALWRERNMHQGRANSAEDAGFPETARKARELAGRVEARITEAQTADAPGSWLNESHP